MPPERAGQVGWLPPGPPPEVDPAIHAAPLQSYQAELAPGASTTLTAELRIIPAAA